MNGVERGDPVGGLWTILLLIGKLILERDKRSLVSLIYFNKEKRCGFTWGDRGQKRGEGSLSHSPHNHLNASGAISFSLFKRERNPLRALMTLLMRVKYSLPVTSI